MTRRTDPVIISLSCEAHPSKDTVELDRADWDNMTPTDRAIMLDNMVSEHINNAGGGGYHIEDEDDLNAVGAAPITVPLPLAHNPAVLAAVQQWLADPNRPSGPVHESAAHLLARIDAAILGKEA